MRARRLLLRTIVVGVCVTGAIAIYELLAGRYDDTSWRILATTTAVSFFGLLGVPAGMLLERGRALTLARTSGALTLVTFVLTIVLVWRHWSDGLGKTWGVAFTLALAVAQAAVVEARRRDTDTSGIKSLAAASMVTGAILAVMGTAAILDEIADGSYYRVMGAVGVLDVVLLVVVAVLRRGVGPIAQTHQIRVDGLLVEQPGRDFAAAVAAAIRNAEKDGSTVRRIERA
jgi:hypothetical protein